MTVLDVPTLKVECVESTPTYGKFACQPLERGFGTTLGSPLRRSLLGGLPGAAITWVRIEGVQHEYSSIPHMKEDAVEFLLNVKTIRIRSHSKHPGRMRLEVEGEGVVKAGDIQSSSDFEIVNPELHLATLDSPEARLSVEFNVELGKGYRPATVQEDLPIGVLPVDAIFGPVRKANFAVERTRVGQVTDYERLVLEVWTDGTIDPTEAVRQAGQTLEERLFLFSNLGNLQETTKAKQLLGGSITPVQFKMPLEDLGLSSRTLNCLKRAGLNKVGEVLEKSKEELQSIRNFGEKSMAELYERLRAINIVLRDDVADPPAEAPAGNNNLGETG